MAITLHTSAPIWSQFDRILVVARVGTAHAGRLAAAESSNSVNQCLPISSAHPVWPSQVEVLTPVALTLQQAAPKCHVFGHIHESRGIRFGGLIGSGAIRCQLFSGTVTYYLWVWFTRSNAGPRSTTVGVLLHTSNLDCISRREMFSSTVLLLNC